MDTKRKEYLRLRQVGKSHGFGPRLTALRCSGRTHPGTHQITLWAHLWLGKGKPYRDNAADFVGRFYYNQKPALLQWALTKPLDRVMYSRLAPRKPDFDLVRDLMIETGVLDRKIEFEEYTDTRFSDQANIQTARRYEPGSAKAE